MKKYIYRGQELDVDALQRNDELHRSTAPILAAGVGLPDKDVAYIFTADDEFDDWARKVKVHDKVEKVKQKADKWSKKRNNYKKEEDERIWARNNEMKLSLSKLAAETGQPITSMELLERWISQLPENDERRDPFIGYDGTHFTGDWFFSCCVAPFFPMGWNDRLSSIVMVFGLGMFCEHEWFGGSKLWLFGLPGAWFDDLNNFTTPAGWGWGNRISSYALTGLA